MVQLQTALSYFIKGFIDPRVNPRKREQEERERDRQTFSHLAHSLTPRTSPIRIKLRVLIALWRSTRNGGDGAATSLCSSCWQRFCSTILPYTAPIAWTRLSILSGYQ
ncbi:hypothetical protein F0562_021726 [Nyssa sinensis]|uniref:Uncharacterized protein n=1 Tax=Nyssa sinensis TaxID=561372 RepID=A0A5J5BLH9_9ASTE|nr:hypothetical protein F0562_021726 [Nyssa sinensis]